MNQLLDGTIRLVDCFSMCDIKKNTYKVYGMLPSDSEYTPVGEYDEFIEKINRFQKKRL